jgi:hypothetical protein
MECEKTKTMAVNSTGKNPEQRKRERKRKRRENLMWIEKGEKDVRQQAAS